MEININNALRVAVSVTLGPLKRALDVNYPKIEEVTRRVALFLLQKPKFSTLIFSLIMFVILESIFLALVGLITTTFIMIVIIAVQAGVLTLALCFLVMAIVLLFYMFVIVFGV